MGTNSKVGTLRYHQAIPFGYFYVTTLSTWERQTKPSRHN